ncbi:MAG TPA: L,D-transpeptidase family protein [Longimicrobiaceae bacterium]|nr:L,D-transpeptidase family protein [Longimicrobiaceae bacterium]
MLERLISSLRGAAVACGALMLLGTAACRGDDDGREAKAATPDEAWSPQNVSEVRGVPARAVRGAIAQRLEAARPGALDARQWRRVQRLYQRYGQGPLWFQRSGLDEARTSALLKALTDAHTDALRLEAYPLNDLARALVAVGEAKRPTPRQLAEADVLLTSAYAALGTDLLTGQVDPRTVSQSWHIDPQEERVDSALTATLRSEPLARAIARMRPQDEDYAALQRELQRYRRLAAGRPWPSVPAGEALKPGDPDAAARLAALRQRLQAEGLLGATPAAAQPVQPAGAGQRTPAPGAVYDSTLAGAVAEYQARHGIEADSVLGEETVASLNVPPRYRVAQIAANLERFRWLPRSLGQRYVLVNVPAFRLEAFDGGRSVLQMRVIVGSEFDDRATPVFSDSMEYAVFRPYWLVPDTIAAKELFPKAQADPSYFATNRYELYQEEGKTRIRQKPGPKNSLGLVKFLFPNEFSIYLHDTPQDSLFREDVRAFSHGCIRLEKPDQLARYALGWDLERIQRAMQEGPDDRRVDLPRKLPVYIAYFTTYMRNGRLYFGNDLYERDETLVRAVAGGAVPSAEALRALESLRRFVLE